MVSSFASVGSDQGSYWHFVDDVPEIELQQAGTTYARIV